MFYNVFHSFFCEIFEKKLSQLQMLADPERHDISKLHTVAKRIGHNLNGSKRDKEKVRQAVEMVGAAKIFNSGNLPICWKFQFRQFADLPENSIPAICRFAGKNRLPPTSNFHNILENVSSNIAKN
ncbi:uncharacterized protein CELE_F12A10.6 [Caenorhabditis elegans]|uniref:Uncharacterized protein F12A10.6 n=1 Tax=Caenorhabditis elegans TaxID=6239 RepID=YSH6_CAEEL|nr:Uncharacterized protein CELE_F12A10.6 [Caenorhabditis elegans]Q09947.1 RecName: Full=Uncharacterized protein F12A10.6 [Caenorhabditis elegans]CCD69293.1 Uncharacterized protein CELE_F12A10.6 [Caenorhabditis elegans]|eukprot:NP_495046.1 Uncharacterized protein CELE_F12A10.6 [Caenorhabditis elegans]